jgi:hypothetical protein
LTIGKPTDSFDTMVGTRIALAIALVASAPAAGCSLVLDFDKPADAAPPDSPATAEQCALNEPNDSPQTATPWAQADVDAGICGGGDRDYFSVTIADGQAIDATIVFDNRAGMGDLDLRLLSADGGTVYDESRSASNMEEVMCPGGSPCPALVAGTYVVEVVGFAPAVISPYVLHIAVTP